MSWLRIYNIRKVADALRNTFLGRTALSANYTSGTTLKVGTDPVGSQNGESGVYLFIDTGTAVTVVEPESAPGEGDGHSEAATIVAPDIDDLHLTLTGGLTYDYTTARGAYVRPTTLPTQVSALKVADFDPTMLTIDSPDLQSLLPAIYITDLGCGLDDASDVQYEGVYHFRARYIRLATPGESRTVMHDAVDAVGNMVFEDQHLGGRVDWAQPTRIVTADQNGNRYESVRESGLLLWADIFVEASLQVTQAKST